MPRSQPAVARLFAMLCLAALVALSTAGGAIARAPYEPVDVIADERLTLKTTAGEGIIPLYVSRDWAKPQPDVTRVLIVLHGQLRNADVYKRSAEQVLAAAGTEQTKGVMLIVPQFLSPPDMPPHQLPWGMLLWGTSDWMGGEPAASPAPLSSYDAMDAILLRLADRTVFPALATVVVAGHSGGGQVVARYAAVAKQEAALSAIGVKVRWVVSNPSSYVYFSPERPGADGRPAAFDTARCKAFDEWKYGTSKMPPYVAGLELGQVEQEFIARDVIYLLGTADTDPNHSALDKRCGAEAQGPNRYARGLGYVAYLRARHGEAVRHRLFEVPGVAHDGRAMFTSACGLAALMDIGTCATERRQ